MMKEQNFRKDRRSDFMLRKSVANIGGKSYQKSKKRIKSGGGEMSRGY